MAADEPRDYSREAAHRRYENAATIAANAGAGTQGGLLDAYKNLLENTEWQPEEGWADDFQEGPAMYVPGTMYQEQTWNYEEPTNASLESSQPQVDSNIIGRQEEIAARNDNSEDTRPVDAAANASNTELNPSFESVQKAFDDWKSSEEQENRMANEANFIASLGGYGAMPAQDLDALLKSYRESGDADKYNKGYAEGKRRFRDSEGDLKTNPLEWNVLGFTSQNKSPKAVTDVYDYYWDQEQQQREEKKQDRPEYYTWGQSDDSVVNEDAIDNGLSEGSRESLWMTGDRYLEYVEKYGIPGRPAELINPNALYNKQNELEEYGFVPYLVSDDALSRFHDDAAATTVNDLFTDVGNLRRTIGEAVNGGYTYSIDGNTYDGSDFDNRFNAWSAKRSPGEVYRGEPTSSDSVPLTMYLIDGVTGEKIYAENPGKITEDEYGRPKVEFGEDPLDDWVFDDENDFKKSLGYEYVSEAHPVVAAYVDEAPLVMGDGQKIRADKAYEIASNRDQYANYGFMDLQKPNVEDPFEPGGGGFLPWIVDTALGSVPLFFAPTAAAQAIGNSYSNLQGFKPGKNFNGEYKLISEDPTRQQQVMSALASATLPLTERLWGIAGKFTSPWFKAMESRFPDAMNSFWGKLAQKAIDEGLEEIPGNIVEEAQQTGDFLNGDFFASPYYLAVNGNGDIIRDAEGNPVYTLENSGIGAYDKQGRAITDQNPSVWNFAQEAPLSAFGGATLGALLGGIPAKIEADQYKANEAAARAERDRVGYNLQVPGFIDEGVPSFDESSLNIIDPYLFED